MKKWINPLERTIQRKQEHQQRRREDSRIESTEPVVWHLSKLPEEFSLLTVFLFHLFVCFPSVCLFFTFLSVFPSVCLFFTFLSVFRLFVCFSPFCLFSVCLFVFHLFVCFPSVCLFFTFLSVFPSVCLFFTFLSVFRLFVCFFIICFKT